MTSFVAVTRHNTISDQPVDDGHANLTLFDDDMGTDGKVHFREPEAVAVTGAMLTTTTCWPAPELHTSVWTWTRALPGA